MSEIKIPPSEIVPIDSLTEDEDNPNEMTPQQFEGLKKNIKQFGFIVDVITNKDLKIADGSHRWRAAKELGMKTISVRRLPLKEVDRRLLRQVLNKLHGAHEEKKDELEFQFLISQGLSTEELAARLGTSESEIYSLLGGELPDLSALNEEDDKNKQQVFLEKLFFSSAEHLIYIEFKDKKAKRGMEQTLLKWMRRELEKDK